MREKKTHIVTIFRRRQEWFWERSLPIDAIPVDGSHYLNLGSYPLHNEQRTLAGLGASELVPIKSNIRPMAAQLIGRSGRVSNLDMIITSKLVYQYSFGLENTLC